MDLLRQIFCLFVCFFSYCSLFSLFSLFLRLIRSTGFCIFFLSVPFFHLLTSFPSFVFFLYLLLILLPYSWITLLTLLAALTQGPLKHSFECVSVFEGVLHLFCEDFSVSNRPFSFCSCRLTLPAVLGRWSLTWYMKLGQSISWWEQGLCLPNVS